MITAFQSTAFQRTAFQIAAVVVAARSGPTRKQHLKYQENAEHVVTGIPVGANSGVFARLSAGAAHEAKASVAARATAGQAVGLSVSTSTRVRGESAPWRTGNSRVSITTSARTTARSGRAGTSMVGNVQVVGVVNPTELELMLAIDLVRRRRRQAAGGTKLRRRV